MQENHYLVPIHQQGPKTDLEHNISALTIEDAEYRFVDAKDRLMDINSWNKYCPAISVEFLLTDSRGMGVRRHARKGDFIRMNIRGMNSAAANFEWVFVEAIEYDDYPDLSMETFALWVRVTDDPLSIKDKHKDRMVNGVTLTFVIERRATKLLASYHGRNGFDKTSDKASDKLLGLPDTEWSGLVKGLLG